MFRVFLYCVGLLWLSMGTAQASAPRLSSAYSGQNTALRLSLLTTEIGESTPTTGAEVIERRNLRAEKYGESFKTALKMRRVGRDLLIVSAYIGIVGAGVGAIGLMSIPIDQEIGTGIGTSGLIIMSAGLVVALTGGLSSSLSGLATTARLRSLGQKVPLTGTVIASVGLGVAVGSLVAVQAGGLYDSPVSSLIAIGVLAIPVGLVLQVTASNRAYKRFSSGLEASVRPMIGGRRGAPNGVALVGRF